jgi:hypothetical protein
MHSRVSLATAIGLACWFFAVPASAADSATAKTDTYDANEKICEKIILTGSRLAAKRVCATRQEWAEKRRRDRDMVDTAQRSP